MKLALKITSQIDQLTKAMVGHELISFMDAYLCNNQIKIYVPDKEKIAFTTRQKIFCYKVMPFG